MDIILVPGLWLDGSSWDRVVPALSAAGHRAHPLTLPGMESRDLDRAGIGLRDHVAAVVAAIDACEPNAQVVLVGHSAGCGVAHAALDARAGRVAHAFWIGGFPVGAGLALAEDFPQVDVAVPLPEWSSFDPADLAGLDDDARQVFRERAIPSPAHVTTDRQQLSDVRRYDIPVTVICTEFTSETLRGWIEDGAEPVQELGAIRRVDYVDLPTGHWPQFSRPEDLAQLIVERLRTEEDQTGAWITPGRFHAASGIDAWRVLANAVATHFSTGTWATAVELTGAILELVDSPSWLAIDLRHTGVTVRLAADETRGFAQRHVELARAISTTAQALGVCADPTAVQELQLAIDATNIAGVRAFWLAVLGYRERDGDVDLLDPNGHGPSLWFQQMDAPRPQRNRIHVDVFVPHDVADARVAAALTAGGHLVTDAHAPAWWVLADTEGNEACVGTWKGRD